MTLTEQWKKGELPEGHYYIKTRSETNIDEYIQWYKDHGIPSEKSFSCFDVQEVIAPVPSYSEWQVSKKYNKHLEEKIKIYERKDKQATETSIAYNELLEENTKLKERNYSLNSRDINLCRIANGIRDENFALKELLKRARGLMNYTKDWSCRDATEEMISKIDNAIGEKK